MFLILSGTDPGFGAEEIENQESMKVKYQMIGIAVLAVFYGCYFIKMLTQHHRGIKTDQIGQGKVGFVKFVEVAMKIASHLVLIVEVVSIMLNTGFFPVSVRIAGAGMGIIGVAVFVVSVLTMRDSWRAGVSKTDETELITGGIYQISRNPAFLGFDLVYVGIVLMFFNWLLLLVSAAAMMMFHLQIVNVEEDFLLETFGDEYIRYEKKVCRYLGRKK